LYTVECVESPDRVIGYARVSTVEQGANGAGLEAQRQAIQAECARRGWTLVRIDEDVQSGKSLRRRVGLERALDGLDSHEADALVVAKLDRLSRSLADFALLVERSRKKDWEIVVLDLNVDTTTPTGEAMASMLAVFSQWERRMIGLRTKEALAVRRQQGVRLGRPPTVDAATRMRVRRMRSRGCSFATIAEKLNEERVPTAHGGKRWYPATVRSLVTATGR
jgi:DNA invertase Pin-like site-specific DNA recombinase